jgi:uncharacterized paraquat-inducible protein A
MAPHPSKAGKGFISEGRMPCPDCSSNIRLPLQSLIAGQAVFCPSCGLKLSIDSAASKSALDSIKKAQAMLNDIDQAHQPLPGYSSQISRGGS